jgi:hypothetical protein
LHGSRTDKRGSEVKGADGKSADHKRKDWKGPPRAINNKQTEGNKQMIAVQVEIKGVTSLIQNRFNEDAEEPGATRGMLVNRGTPREEAEKKVHKDKDGKFYIPGMAILAMLREVAGNHKMKGSRKSAKYVVPAAVRLGAGEQVAYLTNGDGKMPTDFEVDSRPVVIPSTKGRVMRHRPRFDQWGAKFSLQINEKLLPESFIHQLADEAGLQNGLGDLRPQKGGPFGCFQVIKWQILKK